MKTDKMDKILIVVLILLVPSSVVVASFLERKDEEQSILEVKQLNEQKFNKVIEELKTAKDQPLPEPSQPKIEITNVSYATQSGTLTVKGKAPGKNLTVMVSTIVTKHSPQRAQTLPSPSASASAQPTHSAALSDSDLDELVLGEAVDVKAVKTDGSGAFTYVREINEIEEALIDLRFDQGDSTAMVQYSVVEGKRTL